MCGIVGIIEFNKQNKEDKKELMVMLEKIKHRGPDDEGQNTSKKILLGARRLAIVDLSGGNQPLYNEDKTIEIIGNGEIYNYTELQKSLAKKGHRLRSKSDIETAIHLYEDAEFDFVQSLRGMFALALYDRKNARVILARDRMGEKPIYYYSGQDKFIFSSELKGLIADKNIKKELNLDSINTFFYFNYVPEPETPIKGIKKLPAGHMMVINLIEQTIKTICYWNPKEISPNFRYDPTKRIGELLEEACKLTLRADVEVGISLSGGIDSGAILALSSKKYKDRMKAFTVGYEGKPPTDERDFAKMIAEKYDVEHFTAELKVQDMVNHFPQLVYDSDDPIADIAGHAIYSVSKLARANNIKVLLGGIGGDELFWGYHWLTEVVKKNVFSLRKGGNKLVTYQETPSFKRANLFLSKLYSREFRDNIHFSSPYGLLKSEKGIKSELGIARAGFDYIRDIWLLADCIALGDRLSMASSVELRSPFLDYKLVELAYSSQKNILSYKKQPKYWLKKALENDIPKYFLYRQKRAFTPPVAHWLIALLSKYIHLLSDGFLVQEKILSKNAVNAARLSWMFLPNLWISYYQLLVLEFWAREYVWGIDPEGILHAKK